MLNLILKSNSFRTASAVIVIGTSIFLTACGDSLPSDGGGPTTLNSHIELSVDGAFEGIDTLGEQDKENFYAKNSKSAIKACILDKVQNDPEYLDEKGNYGVGVGKRVTDDAPMYKAIAKYGVKELNLETKMAYEAWTRAIALAFTKCIVE